MKKFLKNPILAITLLIAGILLLVLQYVLPMYHSDGLGTIYFDSPTAIDKTDDGIYALVDCEYYVYLLSPLNKGEYDTLAIISADEMECLYDLVFSPEGILYILLFDYETEEIRIDAYNIQGEYIRTVMFEDNPEYADDYINNIGALNYQDDALQFIQARDNGIAEIVTCSLAESSVRYEEIMPADNGAVVMEMSVGENGAYALIYSDRSTAIMTTEGDIQYYLYSDFDFFENPEGEIVSYAVPFKNGIAYSDVYYEKTTVYYKEAPDTEESQIIINAQEIYAEDQRLDLTEEDLEQLFITSMRICKGNLVVGVCDRMYLLEEDGIREFSQASHLPFTICLTNIIHSFGLVIAILLTIAGLILGIGDLMKWKMTMLWKQIYVTIPIVIVMFVILTIDFIRYYEETYYDNIANSLMEFNELIMREYPGDELKQMSNLSITLDGRQDALDESLLAILNHNTCDWSKDMTCSIFLSHEDMQGVLLSTSIFKKGAFLGGISLGSWEEMKQIAEEDSDRIIKISNYTAVLMTKNYIYTFIDAITPIYDSNGNQVAILVSGINFDTFLTMKQQIIEDLVAKSAVFLSILILAIVLMTYLNTRRLKQAGKTITEISAGNFGARIKHSGNDEVGEICNGVNEMAKQLENHFETLDRNEKFYYKFVPEKFRELLHKEAFTDLRLGDAESADLTVLFCDIRSFSLASEMMTAKENFEFVNIIYGKAGPIIRRHNGFVDKYIGDAVMALFEKADDAVAAGIELYKEIVLNPKTAEELNIKDIKIGIGIHSGMARIGIVGEDERLSGTVISNTVNISSRLESLTKQYETAMLITKDTLDRLTDPDSLNTRYLGMVQVAGVNEVKALYEVLDCLEEEKALPRKASSQDFREAIRQFHMGNPKVALEILEKMDCANPADPVPAKYVIYMKEKIASGDMKHNVFQFSRK